MKTLAITLCFLLLLAPAGAQQIAAPPAPSFYVPYAVALNAPPLAGESSSNDGLAELPSAPPAAPQRQRYPVHRGYPRLGRRSMGYRPPRPAPTLSPTAALIIAGAVAGFIVLGAVKGDN